MQPIIEPSLNYQDLIEPLVKATLQHPTRPSNPKVTPIALKAVSSRLSSSSFFEAVRLLGGGGVPPDLPSDDLVTSGIRKLWVFGHPVRAGALDIMCGKLNIMPGSNNW